MSDDPEFAVQLAEDYKASFAQRRHGPDHREPLYPGVRDILEGLAKREEVVLGIATGKSQRGVAAVLEREGLTSHFVTIQTADTHPSKPHPSMILKAMAETGADPADTLMIGDTTYDMIMRARRRSPLKALLGAITRPMYFAEPERIDVSADSSALMLAIERFITDAVPA